MTEPEQKDLAEVVDGSVEEYMPPREEMVLRDPGDAHERFMVLDAHDVAMMVEWAQSSALRRWVYDIPGVGMGLTIHAVQDITQAMNWRGKCRIGTVPETLKVERITEDLGNNGPEPLWDATIFARDAITGAELPGAAMEPLMMKLTDSKAKEWRRKGRTVPEDGRVFDVFSKTKAIQKATRNALAAFIPEEVEQTVIAMFASDASRVERIRTEAEAKVAELAPALTDERATAQVQKARVLYADIRELHGGRGKVAVTPGQFNAWVNSAQHSHDRLDDLLKHLEHLRESLPAQLAAQALQEQAVDSALQVACPACEASPRQFCRGVRGSHRERVAVRLAQLQGAGS